MTQSYDSYQVQTCNLIWYALGDMKTLPLLPSKFIYIIHIENGLLMLLVC